MSPRRARRRRAARIRRRAGRRVQHPELVDNGGEDRDKPEASVRPAISISRRSRAWTRSDRRIERLRSSASSEFEDWSWHRQRIGRTAGRTDRRRRRSRRHAARRLLAGAVADLGRNRAKAPDPRRPGRDRRADDSGGEKAGQTGRASSRSTVPPPEPAEPRRRSDPAQHRLRGRRPHRHRQAGRAGRPSRRRQLDRHAGQRADRPLRRQPVRHRRRQRGRASSTGSTRTPPA